MHGCMLAFGGDIEADDGPRHGLGNKKGPAMAEPS